jgi:hypothetical protein
LRRCIEEGLACAAREDTDDDPLLHAASGLTLMSATRRPSESGSASELGKARMHGPRLIWVPLDARKRKLPDSDRLWDPPVFTRANLPSEASRRRGVTWVRTVRRSAGWLLLIA